MYFLCVKINIIVDLVAYRHAIAWSHHVAGSRRTKEFALGKQYKTIKRIEFVLRAEGVYMNILSLVDQ